MARCRRGRFRANRALDLERSLHLAPAIHRSRANLDARAGETRVHVLHLNLPGRGPSGSSAARYRRGRTRHWPCATAWRPHETPRWWGAGSLPCLPFGSTSMRRWHAAGNQAADTLRVAIATGFESARAGAARQPSTRRQWPTFSPEDSAPQPGSRRGTATGRSGLVSRPGAPYPWPARPTSGPRPGRPSPSRPARAAAPRTGPARGSAPSAPPRWLSRVRRAAHANPPGAKFCGGCATPLVPAARPVAAGHREPRPGPGARRPAARSRWPSAASVSVLFADLVGFTPFAAERDAEEVRELLTRWFDLAADVIGRYGGHASRSSSATR